MKNINKKQQKEISALKRVHFDMNTGVRIFKSAKNQSREERKQADRRLFAAGGGDM